MMKFFTVSPIAVLIQFACLTLATERLPPELAGYYTAREPLHSLFGDLAVSGPTRNVLQNQVQSLPDLIVSSRMPYKPPFIFMIVDPDTSTTGTDSSTGTLHALVDNLSSASYYAVNQSRLFTSTFPQLTPYIGPKQADGEPSHNYTLFIFARPSGFNVPSEYQSWISATGLAGRTGFPLGQFTARLGLGQPIAAMYFRLKLQTATVAAPKVSNSWTSGPKTTAVSYATDVPWTGVSWTEPASATTTATEAYIGSTTSIPTAVAWANTTGSNSNSTISRSLASGKNAMDLLGKTGLACFVVAAMFVFAA